MSRWYSVTFRAPAEMMVWVEADSVSDARARAEAVEYEDASEIEFVKGQRYTMRVRLAPEYQPPERLYG